MSVRLFDWRDIPTLHRYRHDSIYLDSALVLTRGPMLMPGALFSSLAPAMGILTCVVDSDKGPSMIGQAIHMMGSQFAHLTFLAPGESLEPSGVSAMMEYIIALSEERGALRLLADVDEQTPVFDRLRGDGFAIYARQRIWRLAGTLPQKTQMNRWRSAKSQDAMAARVLYANLVPGLVQQVEPFNSDRPRGIVYYEGNELLAYVELKYGHQGIWAQPFIHPDAQELAEHFVEFLQKIPNRRSRPVYVCVRSYQSWLETAIEALGAEAGPRQAVMVRHLAVQQKAPLSFGLPALEGGQPEITAPIVRSESK
jgi:hypothetical protein